MAMVKTRLCESQGLCGGNPEAPGKQMAGYSDGCVGGRVGSGVPAQDSFSFNESNQYPLLPGIPFALGCLGPNLGLEYTVNSQQRVDSAVHHDPR